MGLYAVWGKKYQLLKAFIFIVSIQIITFMIYPQEARTQEITDPEILNLEGRLKEIEIKLVAMDGELKSLNEKLNTVTNEISRLKENEAKSKGIFSGITGIFRRRKIGNLYTESQFLSDSIKALNKRREPLVGEFVALADRLIEKSNSRMTKLMETVRKANLSYDFTTRDNAWKQLSYLWQLGEKTTETRNEYVPQTIGSERAITSPSLLSNDPEELRLGAAIWKDEASAARAQAARLEEQIKNLQKKKFVLEQAMEVSKEMQRKDEERGAVGVGVGTTHILLGSDAATKRMISEIEDEIKKLLIQKQEYENKAERFEGQSRILEQKASQIEKSQGNRNYD